MRLGSRFIATVAAGGIMLPTGVRSFAVVKSVPPTALSYSCRSSARLSHPAHPCQHATLRGIRMPATASKTSRRQRPCIRYKASNTALYGFLDSMQKFFLSGSSYETRIDYNATLRYPGPEFAMFARRGEVPSTLEYFPAAGTTETKSDETPTQPKVPTMLSVATFAGGCFWGMELAYQRVPGVAATLVGYTQGRETFPTYDQVRAGNTHHAEAVAVLYDPSECSYEELLDIFFHRVDPTTVDGQGQDYGRQYRTGVYYHTSAQETSARARFAQEADKFPSRPIATELGKSMPFWPAEVYHQQYLERGGRSGNPQSAAKGATEEIRCYG